MSEEAIAEEFEDELAPPEGGKLEAEAKPIEDDHNEGEQVSEHDEPEYSDAEAKARAGGWRPQDEWEGDPEDWVSHKEFNRVGELMSSIKDAKAEARAAKQQADEQMSRLNQFHESQNKILRAKLAELKSGRTEAINLADVDEANRIQDQIDETEYALAVSENVPKPQPPAQKHHLISGWEAKNEWINNPDSAKTVYANAKFVQLLQDPILAQGASSTDEVVERALVELDKVVAKEFPAVNTNRNKAPSNVRGRPSGKKGQSNQLTMDDLTRDELNMYQEMGDIYKNQDEFLAVVADSRK